MVKKIILILIIAIILGATGYFFVVKKFNSPDYKYGISEQKCREMGGEMLLEVMGTEKSCYKAYTDEGKKCSSGNECESGVCKIDISSERKNGDLYVGTCPRNISRYMLGCGEASIDNGKILNDRRSEQCYIY